jgi:hypothetical protein
MPPKGHAGFAGVAVLEPEGCWFESNPGSFQRACTDTRRLHCPVRTASATSCSAQAVVSPPRRPRKPSSSPPAGSCGTCTACGFRCVGSARFNRESFDNSHHASFCVSPWVRCVTEDVRAHTPNMFLDAQELEEVAPRIPISTRRPEGCRVRERASPRTGQGTSDMVHDSVAHLVRSPAERRR